MSASRLVIVDLGSGNLANLARVVTLAGADPVVTRDSGVVERARCLLLPGVGAFGPARARLDGPLEAAVRKAVDDGAWLFGICLGFQLLFESSEESGGGEGLALLGGHVRRLPERTANDERLQVPHMGWNAVARRAAHPVLDALPDGAAVYYVHSYAPREVPAEQVVGSTTHGVEFTAAAARERVLGVQFHPEKSGEAGVALLRRFVEVTAEGGSGRRAVRALQESLPVGRAPRAIPAAAASRERSFDLFPAIDLRHGRVVRLLHGDDAAQTTYGDDPLATLAAHAAAGARWVHVVDLDAAFGEPPQADLVARLLAQPGRPRVQLGGGMRDEAAIARALAAGAERVVVGSLVARQPERFRALAVAHPGRLVPALDVAAGRLRVAGWREQGPPWQEVARALRGLPCPAVLVTNVERDGDLGGADLGLASAVARESGIPALVSGGVRALGELRAAAARPEIAGAILGRALYEGTLALPAALAAVARATGLMARVIPCLDVAGGRVVKGVRFRDLVDQGVPAEAARRYQQQDADELVFLDIGAAPGARDTATDWVEAVARELTIPLTVGGGVRSREDALRLLRAGADKVGVNTAAVERPALLGEIAERCGQQCVVLAVDAQRVASAAGAPRWRVVTHGGRRETERDALEWIRDGVARGAGEVLLTSVDADGTRGGYDLELLRAASAAVDVPVIASGGAGDLEDLVRAIRAGASAVLAASLFHQGDVTVGEAKRHLRARGIAVRLEGDGRGQAPPLHAELQEEVAR